MLAKLLYLLLAEGAVLYFSVCASDKGEYVYKNLYCLLPGGTGVFLNHWHV